MFEYPFYARSKSDPHPKGLGFMAIEKAQEHCDIMNSLLEDFVESEWNMDYWKTKPEKWEIKNANSKNV